MKKRETETQELLGKCHFAGSTPWELRINFISAFGKYPLAPNPEPFYNQTPYEQNAIQWVL